MLSPYRSVSHIYLQLKNIVIGGAIKHAIYVQRFAGTMNPVQDVVGFSIKPKVGLIVEITAV